MSNSEEQFPEISYLEHQLMEILYLEQHLLEIPTPLTGNIIFGD
jgi:hypothetical protein